MLGPGFKKQSLVFRTIADESKLPPHSDGAARRVSEGIESCFRPQSEFLLHDLVACPSGSSLSLAKIPAGFKNQQDTAGMRNMVTWMNSVEEDFREAQSARTHPAKSLPKIARSATPAVASTMAAMRSIV